MTPLQVCGVSAPKKRTLRGELRVVPRKVSFRPESVDEGIIFLYIAF